MERILVVFFMGFVMGYVLTLSYYDGYVSREYKEMINEYQGILEEADLKIIEKRSENEILKEYIREMRTMEKFSESIPFEATRIFL